MRILNIHEREIPATGSETAELINSLASDHDLLWPKVVWPPMLFDRSLGIGAAGGHGPIRYVVEEFLPGQRVKFRFTGPRGFHGHHWFEVLPKGGRGTVLRHTIDMELRGVALVSWPLVFRPLHDALLEDLLVLAQARSGAVPLVSPWSVWVKFLRRVFSGGKARSQEKLKAMLRDKTVEHP